MVPFSLMRLPDATPPGFQCLVMTSPSDPSGASGAPPPVDPSSSPVTALGWALRGMRSAVSIPALILTAAFVGYAGLARESGLTLDQTLLMTGLVWALPSIVVLTGAITGGMGMISAGLAVALASVRLMPMTMALMPLLRGGDDDWPEEVFVQISEAQVGRAVRTSGFWSMARRNALL